MILDALRVADGRISIKDIVCSKEVLNATYGMRVERLQRTQACHSYVVLWEGG